MDPLIERARAGDAAALEAVLAQVAPAVRRFGRRMCRSESDADDILQDTLLSVATHLGEYEGRASLLSWVFALTRTACARRRRGLKNQAHEEAKEDGVDPGPSPEARAEGAELASALARALDTLSDDHREVILLRDVEELTAPETAQALGISIDAVKSRLHRARDALRAAFEAGAPKAAPGCPDVALMWSRKLEGDLSAVDCAAMEAHIATCRSCSAACDVLKKALLACRLEHDVRPATQARVKAAMRAWAARSASAGVRG